MMHPARSQRRQPPTVFRRRLIASGESHPLLASPSAVSNNLTLGAFPPARARSGRASRPQTAGHPLAQARRGARPLGAGFAPRAARSQCAHSDSTARSAQRLRRSRAGLDVGELGGALADPARHLRYRAPRHQRRQAGRRFLVPVRRLVAMDRASAHARTLAGVAVRDESGVFGDGWKS